MLPSLLEVTIFDPRYQAGCYNSTDMAATSHYRRGLTVVNAYALHPSIRHFHERMKEEFSFLHIDLDLMNAAEVQAVLHADGSISTTALPYDFILYLDKDRYIAKMLEMRGYRLFNKARAIELCDDKMETYIALSGYGIHMPKTITAPLCYATPKNDDFLHTVSLNLSFPLVVKANFGSQGSGVMLVKDIAELKAMEAGLQDKAHLYQEFVETAKGFDYRLIVVNGTFVAGYVRRNLNGDFRSNLAQGGIGEPHQMTESQIAIAEKAARALGLDYCGVDLLESGDPEDPILCEVNSNAFMRGAEEITKINVAEKYAAHIARCIYGE